ncbi:hypothetical protein [Bacillus thuringiensis]|uniref:hypothetical protein n=1 Tax=Bacillus thuringiensis TaxID=1428 RepID=UPI000BFC551E|nr:hypothetical protein [Bacillus thuringiensis]PGT57943.1 hypothetical protein COD16_22435 [Bacillus thuringiensis]
MNLLELLEEEDIEELEIQHKRIGLKVLQRAVGKMELPEKVKQQLQAVLSSQLHKNKIETIVQEIVEVRRGINTHYKAIRVEQVFESNEKVIYLLKPCNDESEFNNFILTLAGIIDKDLSKFYDMVELAVDKKGSINAFEQYLKDKHGEGGFSPNIIQNLRDIMSLRSKKFPTHSDTPGWKKKVNELGFDFPVSDWKGLSFKCLELYLESLTNIKTTF